MSTEKPSGGIVARLEDLPYGERSRRFEGEGRGSSVSFFVIAADEPDYGPVLHRHPYEETFIVLGGAATFEVEGETVEAAAGDVVVAPPNARHKFTNTGAETLRMVTIHPAPKMEQEDLE